MLSPKTTLFFPEPLFDLSQISMATFLYFQDEPVCLTLHPTVSLFMGGADPYYFAELIEKTNPKWINSFRYIYGTWHTNNQLLHRTQDIIEPFRNKFFKTILLSYSRTENALDENYDLIKSSGLSEDELINIIDIPLACEEVISHILYEKFLEYYDNRIPDKEKYFKELKDGNFEETRIKVDYKEIIKYCNRLFKTNTLKELLIKSYFYRIKTLKHMPDILLSNNRLIRFLDNMPIDFKRIENNNSHYEDINIIAWEIFRQLTSKYIDNLDEYKRIEFTIKLRSDYNEEVINLKNKCFKLAEQFKGEKDLNTLIENISLHIKINTEKEIKELLKLDKKFTEEIIDSIFSDEKTWLALGTFLISTITGGGVLITSGAALAAIANVAAKSFKIAAENEKKIHSSDYSLIYRMNNYR